MLPRFILDWLGVYKAHAPVVFHDEALHDLRNKAAAALAQNRFTARDVKGKLTEIAALHEGSEAEMVDESRKMGTALKNLMRRSN